MDSHIVAVAAYKELHAPDISPHVLIEKHSICCDGFVTSKHICCRKVRAASIQNTIGGWKVAIMLSGSTKGTFNNFTRNIKEEAAVGFSINCL